MANTTHTVNPGGGADYTSLFAYEDAIDGTAYGAGETATVNCSGTTADTTAVTFAGWDADVTVYVNGDAHTGIYDTGHYRIEVAGNPVLNIDVTNIKLTSLQITNTATVNYRSGIDINYEAINIDITKCILVGNISYLGYGINSDFIGTIGTIRIWNNILYNWARGGILANVYHITAGTFVIYNNTIFNCAGFGFSDRNNDTDVATYLKNNLIQGCTDDYEMVHGAGVTFVTADNISSDTTSPNNEWDSINVVFVNETVGSENLHLDSTDASGAKDGGTDLSTDSDGKCSFSDDIDGVTRTGTWDIGADEYVSGAPPPAATPYGCMTCNSKFW